MIVITACLEKLFDRHNLLLSMCIVCMQGGTDKMLITPTDMSAFLQFLSDVDEIEDSLPQMETRLTTITNLYNVAQQFEVYVCEEEMALYKSLFTRFRQLKVN